MGKTQSKQKLVFIDTNVFLSCALQESEGLGIDTLKNILEKINNKLSR